MKDNGASTVKEETFFQKERRLKARKTSFTAKYKKGVFYGYSKNLCDYLNQPDVVVRVHATGEMEDGTAFINITIEGFTPSEMGI